MKFWMYSAASVFLSLGTVFYALETRRQFYPTVVFLVSSKFSIVVLGNLAIVCTLIFGKLTKYLFLGNLREIEVEILYEKARYAITETCLALTIFREELTIRVFTLFTALLFSKVPPNPNPSLRPSFLLLFLPLFLALHAVFRLPAMPHERTLRLGISLAQ